MKLLIDVAQWLFLQVFGKLNTPINVYFAMILAKKYLTPGPRKKLKLMQNSTIQKSSRKFKKVGEM